MNGDEKGSKFSAPSTSSAAHSTIRIHRHSSPGVAKRKSPSASNHSSASPRISRAAVSKDSGSHADVAAPDTTTSRNDDSEAETEILSADEEEVTSKSSIKRAPSVQRVGERMSSPSNVKSEQAQSNPSSRRASVGDPLDSSEKRKSTNKTSRDGEAKQKSSSNNPSSSSRSQTATMRAQSAEVAASRASPTSSEGAAPVRKSSHRSRESSSVEPRKRKLSTDNSRSKLEPPRQRLRLDGGSSKSNASSSKARNGSPASPVVNTSNHRRSTSTQSAAVKASLKKRREASTHSQASDSKERWDDDSTDDSSVNGHKDPPVPHLAPPRSSRLASRALNSPVRTAPAPSRRADKYGTTPLAKACEKGEIEDVETAYERAPEDIDKADYGGYTPLQKASLNGSYDVVKFLLDNGCKIDCCSKEERDTPLIDAVENDHLDVVRLLLDRGVNPHASNVKGNRAIDSIPEDGEHADEIRAALEKAMKDYQVKDEDHEQPSSEVSQPPPQRAAGKASTRPDLLYQQPNLQNLLRYSIKGDHEAVAMFLDSVGANNACAIAAARGGHEIVLSFILASHSPELPRDPDPVEYNDETPLLVAIGRGHVNIIKLLLDQDNFNPTRRTLTGQLYWEVAQARRGPRWQAEVDLLKERFDQYVEKHGKDTSSPRTTKKKQRPLENKSGQSPLSDRHGGLKSPRLVKTKSKGDEVVDERKGKRLSNGKESAQKEGQRRKRRVVDDDDSSPNDDLDVEHRQHKVLQRRRASSSASKVTKVTEDGANSQRKIEDASNHKSKSVAKAKNLARVKSEPSHDDRDTVMTDAAEVDQESRRNIEDLKRQLEAEKRKREEIETKACADAAALAAIESAKADAEALQKQQQEAEEQRKSREAYLASLPLAVREAIELGDSRPLTLTWYEDKTRRPRLGVLNQFCPMLVCPQDHIDPAATTDANSESQDLWTLSLFLIGHLGISDFSLVDYPSPKIAATKEQITKFLLRDVDMPRLAYHDQWYDMGQAGYDHADTQQRLTTTLQKCIDMAPMWWLRFDDVVNEIRKNGRFKTVPVAKFRKEMRNTLAPLKPKVSAAGLVWDIFDKSTDSYPSRPLPPSPTTPNGYGSNLNNGNSQSASPAAAVASAAAPLVNGITVNGESASS